MVVNRAESSQEDDVDGLIHDGLVPQDPEQNLKAA
jgi:hypothetical protein